MTDRTGRLPRWSVVAFVAPATAALFTGTMHWAAGHSPTTATASAPVAVSDPVPTSRPPDPRIQKEARRIARLRQQVKALHRQVAALDDDEGTARTAARTSSRTSAKSPAKKSTSAAGKAKPAPAPAAPAPATHTSTGAS